MPTPPPPEVVRARLRGARLRAARVYLLATEGIGARPLSESVEAALAGGVDVVQLREKGIPDDELAPRASALRDLCHRHGALFVVNDALSVARAADADGVHLGQEDAPVTRAREALPPGTLVGVSTHGADELAAALEAGADYVGVGSLFPTSTKGRYVPISGPEALGPLAARAEAAGVPAFGIGGVTAENAPRVAAAGFRRVAVCAGILAAADAEAAARRIRAVLGD